MPDFRRVDRPVMAPSHCAFCPTQKGPLVDTLVTLKNSPWGRLYVCKICGDQIARLLGHVPRAQLNEAVDELERKKVELAHLRRRVDRVARIEGELAQVAAGIAEGD